MKNKNSVKPSSTVGKPSRRRRRFFKFLVMSLLGLVTVIGLYYAFQRFSGALAWARHVEWLEKEKMEPYKLEDILPKEIPDDHNMAMAPIWKRYFDYQIIPGTVPGTDQVTWNNSALLKHPPLAVHHTDPEIPDWILSGKAQLGGWMNGEVIQLDYWQDYYRYLAGKTIRIPREEFEEKWLQPGMERAFEKRFGMSREAYLDAQPDDKTILFHSTVTQEEGKVPSPYSVPETIGEPAVDVLIALNGLRDAYEAINEAAERPLGRFPLNYEAHWGTLLPHLYPLKSCAQYLSLKAVAELQSGNTDNALNDILLGFRLTDALDKEPILISHLVSKSMKCYLLQPVWEGIQSHAWSDEQSWVLENNLGQENFLQQIRFCIQGDRGMALAGIDGFTEKDFRENFGESNFVENTSRTVQWLLTFLSHHPAWMPSGWVDFNKMTYSIRSQSILDLFPSHTSGWAQPSELVKIEEWENELGAQPFTPKNWLVKAGFPTYFNAARKGLAMQASVEMMRTALALNRYKSEHEQFPSSLDQLDFEKSSNPKPIDPVNGQSLQYHYQPGEDLYTLYSLGWNEKDDMGELVSFKPHPSLNRKIWGFNWFEQGDWVWPQRE